MKHGEQRLQFGQSAHFHLVPARGDCLQPSHMIGVCFTPRATPRIKAFQKSYILGMGHMCALYTILLLSYTIIKHHINCENNIINLSYTSPINHEIKVQVI